MVWNIDVFFQVIRFPKENTYINYRLYRHYIDKTLGGNVLTSSVAFSASEEGLKFQRASQLLEQIQTTLHAVLSTKSAEMCWESYGEILVEVMGMVLPNAERDFVHPSN